MNLIDVSKFTTEDECWEYLEKTRWPGGVRCPYCSADKVASVRRKTQSRNKRTRLYQCLACDSQFSATSGTIFHDSHLPLRKWFVAMALICEAKKGVSAMQVSRHLGIQYKTAWHLCHRIRRAMGEKAEPLGLQGQIVEIDETYLGGHPKKYNKAIKRKRLGQRERMAGKITVFGMAERGGRVYLRAIPDVQRTTLAPIVAQNLSPNAGPVITDAAPRYSFLIPKDKHVETNHGKELAEMGEVTGKTIEGVFSLFKRGIVGSYHKLSRDHINAYLGEFCWRYNRRYQQRAMFDQLLDEVAHKRPYPYKELIREF